MNERASRLRPLLLAAGLALLAVLGVGPAAFAHSNVRLATQDVDHPLRVKPPVVGYTGDGTGYLGGRRTSPGHQNRGGLHWHRWGRRKASADGYAWLNDCRPSCAEGTFHPHRAKVHAGRPRHRKFTRLTIKFRYRGRWAHDHRALIRTSGYYQWAICGTRFTKPC